MNWPTAALEEVAEVIRGVTFSKADASLAPTANSVPVLRAGNISDELSTGSDLVFVDQGFVSTQQLLRPADIVVCMSSGSAAVLGKSAILKDQWHGSFGAFLATIRTDVKLACPRYIAQYLRTPEFRRWASSSSGIGIKNIRASDLKTYVIPLPPLDEQKRIAAILDQADALRRLRARALDRLNALGQAIFHEMFGDLVANSMGWPEGKTLGDVADIASGVTKGRKANGKPTRDVPYLAVSNVQDQHLKMDVVKTIEATEEEVERYRLLRGDLLLTEGGDPDKLGRGTLWRDELPECIHQNHFFRVRLTSENLRPLFLAWLVGSQRGKRYFFRSSKQTTGIASINKSQLREFPLLVPPLAVQVSFEELMSDLKSVNGRVLAAADAEASLFTSLQHRAFRGEL